MVEVELHGYTWERRGRGPSTRYRMKPTGGRLLSAVAVSVRGPGTWDAEVATDALGKNVIRVSGASRDIVMKKAISALLSVRGLDQ